MMEQNTNRSSCEHSTATVQEINLIKECIRKQPHLPQQHDDKWLENFLRGCKFSVERFKKVFDNFYTERSRYPQYFLNGDPSSQNIKQSYHIFMPDTHESYIIFLCRLLETDESKFDSEAFVSREMLIFNWLIRTQSNLAFVGILDMRGSSMAHVPKAVPYVKNLLYILQDAVPFRFKQFHFIHRNPLLNVLLSITTPFMKEKLRNRIHIHTDDLSTLYKFIPQELLPNEYSGKAGTIRQLNDELQKTMENTKDFFMEEYKKKTDESNRIKDCIPNEMFGVDGSFKSLNID